MLKIAMQGTCVGRGCRLRFADGRKDGTMSEIFSKLWTLYQGKPAQVTVLSSGALLVDAVRLLSSVEARKQLEALQDFPTTKAELPLTWPVRMSNAEQPLPEGPAAE